MRHRRTRGFREAYEGLPVEVRRVADRCFDLLRSDPRHPSLHFKCVARMWSVRVGLYHRALGVDIDDGVLWIWIGTHAEYDRMVR